MKLDEFVCAYSLRLSGTEKIILILIMLLAAFLRLVALTEIPTSFHHDELLSTYEAYSILKTGYDHRGFFLPLRFKAFGDWPPPLYFYFNLPFVLIFGLEEIVVRLPAALLGIATVFLTFLLVKELFKNKTIALLATLFMAISPWHLHYSRLGWPAIMVPFLITFGLWLFFVGLNNKKNIRIYFGIFFISLSVWAYAIASVFVPLLLLGILFFYRKKVEKKVIFYSFSAAFIVLLPFYILTFLHPEWQTRFNQISIFSVAPNLSTLIYLFFYAYLFHLSPYFLFLHGDANLRHNILGIGQLYFFEMFLLFCLLVYLIICLIIKRKTFPNLSFIFYWLLIFPLPASLTFESIPHATRTIVGLPLLHIFSALGLYSVILGLRNKFFKRFTLPLAKIVLVIIVFFSFLLYAYNYYFLYPKYSASRFGYGQKEVVRYIEENYDYYEKFIFSGEIFHPYLYLLFYLRYQPEKFLAQVKINKEIEEKLGILTVKSFNKFEFRPYFIGIKDEEFLPKVLYIEKRYLEGDWETKGLMEKIGPLKIKKIIYLPNGQEAYRIMALE